jgi:hypothetical protein
LIARPSPSLSLATVSASALARHLDCSRTYIGKLEAEGLIQRQGDRFPLDQSRVAYLRYLRRERRQSPRSEADADFQRAKAELIRLRIAEKQRRLILLEEAVGHMDEVVGLFLSRLSGFAARCGGRDQAALQAEPSGRAAAYQDYGERSTVDIVAGRTVKYLGPNAAD